MKHFLKSKKKKNNMKKNIHLVFIVILFFTIQAKAQIDFRPGYFISNENDTIFGLIDYRGDARNAKVCVYKQDEKSEPLIFQPFEIISYRFSENKFYISKMVPTKEGEKPVFLEFLVKGIANLYFYQDEIGNHYLIEKEGEVFIELTNEEKTIYVDNIKYIKSTNKHIGLLKATFADCERIFPDIDRAKLDHGSLIKITTKYHKYVCEDGEECIIYEKKPPVVRLKIAPTIGLGVTILKFSNPKSLYEGFDFERSGNWAAGLKINISLPRSNEKISLMIDALVEKNYFYSDGFTTTFSTDYYNEIQFQLLSLKNSFSLNYTFPKGKFRPTINIGGIFCVVLDQKSNRISEVAAPTLVDTFVYYENLLDNTIGGGTIGLGLNYNLTNNKTIFLLSSFEYLSGSNVNETLNSKKKYYTITTFSIRSGIYF